MGKKKFKVHRLEDENTSIHVEDDPYLIYHDEPIPLTDVEEEDDLEELDCFENLSDLEDLEINNVKANDTLTESYLVRIIAGRVKYFSGPGTDYSVVGLVKKDDKFTIINEAYGPGAHKWGKLDFDETSWIPLDYCEKIVLY